MSILNTLFEKSPKNSDTLVRNNHEEIRMKVLDSLAILTMIHRNWKTADEKWVLDAIETIGSLTVEIGCLAGYTGEEIINDFSLIYAKPGGELPN